MEGVRPGPLGLADSLADLRELQVVVVELGALRGVVEEAVGAPAPVVSHKVPRRRRHAVGAGLGAGELGPLLCDWLRAQHPATGRC